MKLWELGAERGSSNSVLGFFLIENVGGGLYTCRLFFSGGVICDWVSIDR